MNSRVFGALCAIVSFISIFTSSPAAAQEGQQVASIPQDVSVAATLTMEFDTNAAYAAREAERIDKWKRAQAYCRDAVPPVLNALIYAHPEDVDYLRSPEFSNNSYQLCWSSPIDYSTVLAQIKIPSEKKKK